MKFSNWKNWKDINQFEGIKNPGIYCIAVIDLDITNEKFHFKPEIEYIGMTNSKGGLKSRLLQFDHTIRGKLQHGGADRFINKYHDIPYNELIKKMYVSVWTFDCSVNSSKYEDLLVMGEVAKSEYVCFAEYIKLHGKLPDFNSRNAEKYSKKPKK